MCPPTPTPSATEERRGHHPRSEASFSLGCASRPAARSPVPPAAPWSGKRGGRAGRSPRGRFPPPPQPPPPHTPGTRPGPRGSHRVTQPDRRLGEGRHRAAAPRSEEGARRPPVGIPSHPAPSRRAPLHTLPPPLLSGPESVTGIGFQHGGQEAAPRGGENIPAMPALGGAGLGSWPLGPECGVRCPKGASKGGNNPRDEGFQPSPHRGTPRPQVGLRWQ